jgi:hypothetical protein
VHGLDIHSAVLLADAAMAKIREATVLAPLHNPPGLQGIEAAMKVFAGVPQVRVCACVAARCTWSQRVCARRARPRACLAPALCAGAGRRV